MMGAIEQYKNGTWAKIRRQKREERKISEADVARGTPERLKLGGSSENHQLIYLSESVHRPCHVRLNSQ